MGKLGLGCMRLPLLDKDDPYSFDYEQITKMVDTFIEQGFSYFDTAYFYHEHQSERIVKKVIIDRYPREKIQLATKLPTMHLKEKADVERIFNEQLDRTGAGFFDYYLFHCITGKSYETVKEFDAFSFIEQKKREGKIRHFGFSFHDTAEVLDKVLTEHPEFEFVQLQINYLDWENPDVQSRKCYEIAKKHNKKIIIMEPVKGGTLASLPESAEKLFKDRDKNMSVPSWALRFAASLDNVMMVLSGMSNMEQLLDNISFMKDFVPLTEEEKELCFKAADIIKKAAFIPCTACRYCIEECPKNISIPTYFSMYNRFLNEGRASLSEIKESYEKLIAETGNPEDCIGCKKCEGACPQHIGIVDKLKVAVKRFL